MEKFSFLSPTLIIYQCQKKKKKSKMFFPGSEKLPVCTRDQGRGNLQAPRSVQTVCPGNLGGQNHLFPCYKSVFFFLMIHVWDDLYGQYTRQCVSLAATGKVDRPAHFTDEEAETQIGKRLAHGHRQLGGSRRSPQLPDPKPGFPWC